MKKLLIISTLTIVYSQTHGMEFSSLPGVAAFFGLKNSKETTNSAKKDVLKPEDVIFQYVKKQYPHAQESILLRIDPQAKTITREQPVNNGKLDRKSLVIGAVIGVTTTILVAGFVQVRK